MSTIERAWRAFLDAVEEAKALHASGAASSVITNLLQHARELLDIIEDEARLSSLTLTEEIREGLAEMRTRLAHVERSLVARH